MKNFGAVVILIAMTGCTTQRVYEAIQVNQKQLCEQYRGQQQDDCLDSFSQSYDQYTENRKTYD